MTTFFYSTSYDRPDFNFNTKDNYAKLDRQIKKKIKGLSKILTDIYIPINSNNHWFLLKVSLIERKIYVFDSLKSSPFSEGAVNNLRSYFSNSELISKLCTELCHEQETTKLQKKNKKGSINFQAEFVN